MAYVEKVQSQFLSLTKVPRIYTGARSASGRDCRMIVCRPVPHQARPRLSAIVVEPPVTLTPNPTELWRQPVHRVNPGSEICS